MLKTLLIKNNKKREAALKMKRAGTRNIFFFYLVLNDQRVKSVMAIVWLVTISFLVWRQLKIEGATRLYVSKLSTAFFSSIIETGKEFDQVFSSSRDFSSGKLNNYLFPLLWCPYFCHGKIFPISEK